MCRLLIILVLVLICCSTFGGTLVVLPKKIPIATVGGGGGSIAFVQANTLAPGASSSTTIATNFTAGNTAGNLIVVTATCSGTPSFSVADSKVNTYTACTGSPTNWAAGGARTAMWYAKNIGAGANTVTVTFGSSVAFREIVITEYSGCSTTAPFDTGAAFQTSLSSPATATSPSITLAGSGEVIVASWNFNNGPNGAGTGYTQRINNQSLFEDKLGASSGANTASCTDTFSGSDPYAVILAAFKQ